VNGWLKRKEYTDKDAKLSLWVMITADITATFGLLLYFVFSPITQLAFRDFGAAMKDSELRLWAVEHILTMLIAVVLVHGAKKVAKKEIADSLKFRKSLIFYGLALILILSRIPWAATRWDFSW